MVIFGRGAVSPARWTGAHDRPRAHGWGRGDRNRAREWALAQTEADIDDLFFLLKTQGGMPEAEARLREVRRILYRGLEG